MKAVITKVVIVIIIVTITVLYGLSILLDEHIFPEPWNVPDVDGNWGTTIIVEYKDGTFEYLTESPSLLPLEVQFGGKAVDCFKYILSFKGTSSISYDMIEIDISNFDVLTTVDGQGQWGEKSFSSDVMSLAMDGNWWEIYSVSVDANELEVLETGRTYNFSFTPSGVITYRGTLTDPWGSAPLPSWFYLNFKVRSGTPDDPDDPTEKWIDVELYSETITT